MITFFKQLIPIYDHMYIYNSKHDTWEKNTWYVWLGHKFCHRKIFVQDPHIKHYDIWFSDKFY